MVKMSYDVVKRWVNEAQEAASSDNIMVQVGGVKNEMHFNLTSLNVRNLKFSENNHRSRINQKLVSCLSSTTPWACCITSGRTTAWLSPRCWTSSPNQVWSPRLPTACSSGSLASCWMRRREGEIYFLFHSHASWRELELFGNFFFSFFVFNFLNSHDSPLFDFIESCLRNKNEMVVYEAASAIVHMPNCTARELAPAVSGQHWLVCFRLSSVKLLLCVSIYQGSCFIQNVQDTK